MLAGVRDRLVRKGTQLVNAIRGFAAAFGLTATKGKAHLIAMLEHSQADESLPALTKELFTMQTEEYTHFQTQITEVDAKRAACAPARSVRRCLE